MSKLFEIFRNTLKESSTPVLVTYSEYAEYLSAANIYTSVISRVKDLKRLGLSEHKVLVSPANPKDVIVDFLACLRLKASYYPITKNNDYQIIDWKDLKLTNTTYCPLILETSGTFEKKRFAYSEEAIIFQLEAHEKFFNDFSHSHKLSILPLNHCFGLVLDYFLGIKMNCYISFLNPSFCFKEFKNVIHEEEVDFITGVPKQLEIILHFASIDSEIKKKLKNCTFFYGGAPLRVILKDNAKKIFKNIIEGHGLTEAGPGVLMNGVPLPGVKVKLVDDQMLVKSPSVIPNSTNAEGWLETNDLFYQEGTFQFMGRSDEFLKSSNGKMISFYHLEQLVLKRFSLEVSLIKNQHKIILILIKEKKCCDMKFKKWIDENYPTLKHIMAIDKSTLIDKLIHSRGKSRSDVLKDMTFGEETAHG